MSSTKDPSAITTEPSAITREPSARTTQLSARGLKVQPFHVMEIMRLADSLEQAGQDVIHLELGEPSFSTPEPIVAAGQKALAAGQTHYTRAIGIEPLRKAIAGYYKEQLNCDIDWQRIVVSSGASSALFIVLSILLNPKDKILLSDPGYPCYPNFVELLNGESVYVELDEKTGFKLKPEQISQHWDALTKAVLIASPANPTGAMLNANELDAIADSVRNLSGTLIVDEIYQGLTYSNSDNNSSQASGVSQASSVLQVADDAIVINSFSKYFGMTGWRIGWAVLPESMVSPFEKMAQNLTISPPTISQFAALEAFSDETFKVAEQQRQAFEKRRDFLVAALRELGFGISVVPDGAFYIYANVEKFTDNSFEFCQTLLKETGVAVTPGLDFSPKNQKRFVRFSYTAELKQLKEAVERIAAYLAR